MLYFRLNYNKWIQHEYFYQLLSCRQNSEDFTLDECLIKNCSETGVRILKVLSQIQTDKNDQKLPF